MDIEIYKPRKAWRLEVSGMMAVTLHPNQIWYLVKELNGGTKRLANRNVTLDLSRDELEKYFRRV